MAGEGKTVPAVTPGRTVGAGRAGTGDGLGAPIVSGVGAAPGPGDGTVTAGFP